MASDQEQGVVDPDTQTDHRRHLGGEAGDVDQIGDETHRADPEREPDQCHADGKPHCDERSEGHQQDDDSGDESDHLARPGLTLLEGEEELASGLDREGRCLVEVGSQRLQRVEDLGSQVFDRQILNAGAHHVSAIAIRAQAGQALAATSPEAALDALRIVEREASATLAEVRSIVGVLRADEAADLTPQQGLRDIPRLAAANGNEPAVEVDMSGPLEVAASVGSAAYRIAQESVTNALRHGSGTTTIRVGVSADERAVRLRIENDGRPVGPSRGDGFGIQGMKERAALLGGSLSAGPKPGGGWIVAAELPRDLG